MNVRRGLFRVWVGASVLWMLGSTYWLLRDASEFHKTLVRLNCEQYLGKDSGRWRECWNEQRGPNQETTWFEDEFKSGNWVSVFIPPFVIGGVGFAVFLVGRWFKRGFDAEGGE